MKEANFSPVIIRCQNHQSWSLLKPSNLPEGFLIERINLKAHSKFKTLRIHAKILHSKRQNLFTVVLQIFAPIIFPPFYVHYLLLTSMAGAFFLQPHLNLVQTSFQLAGNAPARKSITKSLNKLFPRL